MPYGPVELALHTHQCFFGLFFKMTFLKFLFETFLLSSLHIAVKSSATLYYFFILHLFKWLAGSRGALCSNTPLTQSISPVTDRMLSPPLAALSVFLISPTSFPFQFSVSISGHLFYLNYFREIAALQSQRQSPSRFPGPL